MASILNINSQSEKFFQMLLSDFDDNNLQPYFCERASSEIWDFHYRKLPFTQLDNGWFVFDLQKFMTTFDFTNEKVFDCWLLNDDQTKKESLQVEESKEIVSTHKQSLKTSTGTLNFSCYKNGSNMLSARVSFVPSVEFLVKLVECSENEFDINISTNKTVDANFFLAKKSTNDSLNKYDLYQPLQSTKTASGFELVLNKKDILPLSNGGNETWDFIAKINNFVFEVKTNTDYCFAQFDVNEKIKATLQISNKKTLTFKTAENTNLTQPKIKVAVLGSCYARQPFNSSNFFNPDYKRFYECGLTAYHFSFASMLSKPIEVNEKDLVGPYQSDLNVHGKIHFEKNFLNLLKDYKPDYLIVENYVHVSAALIETTKNRYIDENYYLVDTPAYKNLEVVKRIPAESEEHFELFKSFLPDLKQHLQDILPQSNIIVVRTQPALQKLDNNVLSDWENNQIIKYRRFLWERYDSCFISTFPQARVIDMRNDKYVSDRRNHLKFAPAHFNTEYYKDFLNSFNKIVLQDLIKKLGDK